MVSIFAPLTDVAGSRVHTFFQGIDFGFLTILDFLLVGLIMYWIYTMLRETRAFGILYGLLILVLGYIIAKLLRLELLALLMSNFLTLLFVAIPVLFQPELRRLLERLGRARAGMLTTINKTEYEDTVTKVSEAARIMALANTGAIIAFRRTTGLADLITSGTFVDAQVSTPLLLNIFFNKSPLHDGAVIIDKGRISRAGVMLPLSEKEYGHTLGSRHRAAVGLTEQCDAVVVVVSEERGIISLVVGGKITPGISPDILEDVLSEFLTRKSSRKVLNTFRQKSPSLRRKKNRKTAPEKP